MCFLLWALLDSERLLTSGNWIPVALTRTNEKRCVDFISSVLQFYTLTCEKNSSDSEGHFKYTKSNCCRTFTDAGQYSNCGKVY